MMICHCCFIVNKKRKQRSPDENIHKIRKTIYEFVMGPDKDFTAVTATPVVNPELPISPRLLEKIRNGPNGTLWGWGETDS
jgi:hypothetical protein